MSIIKWGVSQISEKYLNVKYVIDRFEEWLLKEIDRYLYDTGTVCPTAIYERLTECLKAREELGYKPVSSVKELIESYNYDQEYIEAFLSKVNNHTPEECPEL